MYNNAPALKLYLGERFEGLITVEITDGLISHFYAMRNPDKLAAIDIPREISRELSDKLSRCGSTGSATWAARRRCCGRSLLPRSGADCRRPPR